MRLTYVLEKELRDLGIRSGVVAEMKGLSISEGHPDLEEIKAAAAADIMRATESSIKDNPVLEGYRELVRGVGRSLKKFPPAAESLIAQVRRTKHLPTINTAVDAYNVVVTRRCLALGVHDMAKIGQTIRFRLSPGGEPFVAVGSEHVKTTQAGDFLYADEKQVLAWLDSKDSDRVKVSLDTTDLIMVIQGTPQTDREYNVAAAKEACSLITQFCGGQYEIGTID
jgi:DNA/RNA-binding domain of Phe-tRNA-synthetase-like protein